MLCFNRTQRWLTVLLVGVAASAPALAQQPARLVISPVPIWNDAVLPDKPGAFFDPSRNQVIIVLSAPGEGGLRQLRYDVPNRAEASVEFSIQPSADGVLHYTYALNDAPRAPQRSKRVRMLLPAHDASLLASSNRWQFETEATSFPDRTATMRGGLMRFAAWRDPAAGEDKVAGLIMGLDSKYFPGFVDAFVEGQVQNPLGPDILATVPAEIKQQVQHFLEPGTGNTPQIVLGPLFRPDTPKEVIAANYHFGVSVLQRRERIGADSLYAQQLLDRLNAPNVWVKIGGDDTRGGTGHGSTAYNRYMQTTPSSQIHAATQDYLAAHTDITKVCLNDQALQYGGKFDICALPEPNPCTGSTTYNPAYRPWLSPHQAHDRGTAADVAGIGSNQCANAGGSGVDIADFINRCVANGASRANSINEGNHAHCQFGDINAWPH